MIAWNIFYSVIIFMISLLCIAEIHWCRFCDFVSRETFNPSVDEIASWLEGDLTLTNRFNGQNHQSTLTKRKEKNKCIAQINKINGKVAFISNEKLLLQPFWDWKWFDIVYILDFTSCLFYYNSMQLICEPSFIPISFSLSLITI